MAIWQPKFRKDNPSTKKPLSQLARDTFQEGETLLLRNSIEDNDEEEEEEKEDEEEEAEAEAGEEEEEEEEEEDEDLFESYITNGTHPPAPPDR